MTKRINSRNKGKRGERAFRDVLREAGYLKARRGQQFSGEQGNPDVVCEELPEIHWEVKCCEAGNPYKWLDQASRDCAGSQSPDGNPHIVAIAHKKNGKDWLAVMYMDELLEIIRRSDLPRASASKLPELEGYGATKVWTTSDGRTVLDCVSIPHNGKGKISIPVKPNGLS